MAIFPLSAPTLKALRLYYFTADSVVLLYCCFLFPFIINISLENIEVLDSAIIAQKNMFHYEIMILLNSSPFNCHLKL